MNEKAKIKTELWDGAHWSTSPDGHQSAASSIWFSKDFLWLLPTSGRLPVMLGLHQRCMPTQVPSSGASSLEPKDELAKAPLGIQCPTANLKASQESAWVQTGIIRQIYGRSFVAAVEKRGLVALLFAFWVACWNAQLLFAALYGTHLGEYPTTLRHHLL